MASTRFDRKDIREKAEASVQRHLLIYSLFQLRLIGALVIITIAIRVVTTMILALDDNALQRFDAISDLTVWLLFLPLGFGLFLLGGGIERRPSQIMLTTAAHHSLLPISICVFIALPLLTIHDALSLKQQYQHTVNTAEELARDQDLWLQEASGAESAEEIRRLARSHQISLPPADEKENPLQTLWRYGQMLEKRKQTYINNQPILRFAWSQDKDQPGPFIDTPRTISTLLMQIIVGIGLLKLSLLGTQEIRRLNLTPRLFFEIGGSTGARRKDHSLSRSNRSSRTERLKAK
jgi:hypothetical protein